MKIVDYHGIEGVELASEHLSLLATVSVALRLLSLWPQGGKNSFTFLP